MGKRYLCKLCTRGCVNRKECINAPILNLGSGVDYRLDMINFDVQTFSDAEQGERSVDILGDMRELSRTFHPNTFNSIFCCHVIEHFERVEGIQLLKDCLRILQRGGKLVLEGPDVEKVATLFVTNNPLVPSLEAFVQEIYGTEHYYGMYGKHKWGWTGKTLGEALEEIGYKIEYIGAGHTHSRCKRDFRVVGVKP